MNRKRLLWVALFVFNYMPLVGAEEITCSSEQRFKGGRARGVELELKVERGRVIGLDFSNFYASGREGGAYFCSMDTSRPDAQIKWSLAENKTVLEIVDEPSREKSVVEIENIRNGHKIKFVHMWRGYCGFGVEFPVSVVVEKGKRECAVTYRN